MPLFIPHKVLVEVMWYGGLSVPQIDGILIENKYNSLPTDVYEAIIEEVASDAWKEAHSVNSKIYETNSSPNYTGGLKNLYYIEKDFDKYGNPGIVYDVMTYMVGARRSNKGIGTTKVIKIFTTDKLRRFVEMSRLVGMSSESMRQYLQTLEPNFGIWQIRPLLTYINIFWDASRLTFRDNSIRVCDVRNYLTLDRDNRYYEPHLAYLDSSEDDLLCYFGLADYSTVHRKNKSLHGKIGSKIMDYFDDKSRKILPSDYIKLYVHLDTQIQELESQDKGAEAYRNELKRIFERLQYSKDAYKTMDELNELYITTVEGIETDEPFVKEEI